MENALMNIDFEGMSYEQLMAFEEKAKDYKQKSLDRRVVELENWKRQADSRIDLLENENKELKESNSLFISKIEDMDKKTSQVTETFLTHGIESRQCENLMHKLIYKELDKGSIRDLLFHGLLTRMCKGRIVKALGVTAWCWIEVKNVHAVNAISTSNLNKTTIHIEMQKKAKEMQTKFEKLEGKPMTDGDIKRKAWLELLIDECEGDVYAI